MNLMTILLQAGELAGQAAPEAEAKSGGGSNLNFLIMMGLIIVVMYFFMIRPQQKRQKEMQTFRKSLEKGSKIVTAGGIYGVIKELADTYVVIEVDNNVTLRVDKTSVMRAPEAQPQPKK